MSNSLDTKQSAQKRAARGDGALDHGLLPRLVGYQLRLAQLAVFRDFDRATADLGLTPGRFGMLVLIEANPGVTQSALARAVGLDRSTLVALLDQLEDRRLVARRQGEDRRTNGLWLTAAGQRSLGKMKRRVAAHEARVAARLTRAERELLLGALRRLAA
jgi:DNA-binding MarR family transcriptional regulator